MASHVLPGVLQPIPLNRVPHAHHQHNESISALPPLKKRKTSLDPSTTLSLATSKQNDWLSQPITIRAPSPSLTHDEPFILTPLALIPRSRLPFAWLEPMTVFPTSSTIPSPQIQSGCFFVAHIPVLEHCAAVAGNGARLGREREGMVLAARISSSSGELVVVERVKRGVFALLRVGAGVGEGELVVASVSGKQGVFDEGVVGRRDEGGEWEGKGVVSLGGRGGGEGEWWEAARIEEPGLEHGVPRLGKRARVEVAVVFAGVEGQVRPQVEIQNADAVGLEGSASAGVEPGQGAAGEGAVVGLDAPADTAGAGAGTENVDALRSPQELLDNLREQYLQALYISKTSVAYFAKGPLARCRSAFQSSESEGSKPADLIAFYREAILVAKKMDLKYRETLPAMLNDVLLTLSDDEAATKKKKRKNAKKTLGKNGLYPEEPDLVRKWWKNRTLNDQGMPMEGSVSRETESKKMIADLRLRETQLQILLILETMSLEAAAAEGDQNKPTGSAEDAPEAPTKKEPKFKKKQDLNTMLELHLDRLCIWYAVSFEETVVPDTSATYGNNHLSGKKVESDAVRDFCTEVIIPFYASRLPDKCKSITRKLGVSSAISPFPKQPQAKKAPRGEPGTPVERQQAQKQSRRRTFQRVLTDQATSQTRHTPSLSRSNTTPAQAEARRNSLDPLLPVVGASVRGGIQKAKRAENREVDLNAVARQHETKLKKMQMLVEQKKELDAAINALRKPNRELVAKDIADDAVKRHSTGTVISTSSRKPKNPVRNPMGQGVQVAATPKKGSRKKDAIVGMPPLPPTFVQSSFISKPTLSMSSPFNSEPQMVPGSTIRSGSLFFGSSSHGQSGAIQETPIRRPPQPLLADPTASPLSNGPSALFRVPPRQPVPAAPRSMEMAPSTPVQSRRHVDTFLPRVKPSMVMETPPKPAPIPVALPAGIPIPEDNPVPGHVLSVETPAKAPATVLSTPVRKPSAAKLMVPATSAAVPVTPEKSIYSALGWDDDDDLAM
ncbi:uncharacterized protein BO97DRAFT_478466 [Aspergillus homomorphus CBS 101889]|uniref:DNA replication regulator Sld3 C-terminal domain-containing protein n=1 Tax=Aspergillus homomorphus (strain CBS 101889) TaxID=1450537 RepID=A0A395HU02_ASPHC|nr:hypothetical protein BO97DRAFT_478466 [Aspergillus homomorphus CBS 101889]RAL11421.1 hypothetical protein BO97DRAFT_478466 [Aspergillus homomorphus CBS 101889]